MPQQLTRFSGIKENNSLRVSEKMEEDTVPISGHMTIAVTPFSFGLSNGHSINSMETSYLIIFTPC
jgi:hypothetical protein